MALRIVNRNPMKGDVNQRTNILLPCLLGRAACQQLEELAESSQEYAASVRRKVRMERAFPDPLLEDDCECLKDSRVSPLFRLVFLIRVRQQLDDDLVLGASLKGNPQDPF